MKKKNEKPLEKEKKRYPQPIRYLGNLEKERYLRAAYYSNYIRNNQSENRYNRLETREIPSRINLKDTNMNIDADQLFYALQLSRKALRFEKSKIHSWGVRTDEPIAMGEPIIEYVGEMIRHKVLDHRQERYEKEGNNGSYVFRIDDDTYVDATKTGGLARYINHSCEPNCETKIIPYESKKRVVIFAKRDIEPCEELSYDYMLPYETKDKAIKCCCGSKFCKGWLNWRPESENKLTDLASLQPPNKKKKKSIVDIKEDDAAKAKEKSYLTRKLLHDVDKILPGDSVNDELREIGRAHV